MLWLPQQFSEGMGLKDQCHAFQFHGSAQNGVQDVQDLTLICEIPVRGLGTADGSDGHFKAVSQFGHHLPGKFSLSLGRKT